MGKKQIFAFGLMGVAAASAAAAPVGKPNIVIVVADDLGWGDVGFHGSVIRTPNLDAFADDAIQLNRYYVAPISSPTRAGLMTGRYPNRFGFRESVIPPWRDAGLPLDERTIADVLGENGYTHRAAIGKWHLGHSRKEYYPLNRGFTHFYGLLNGSFDYFTHEREGELDWHNDWSSCYDKGYSTDLIGDEAVRCISEYAREEAPFFVYVAFNAPHSPYQAPEEEIEKYIPKAEFDKLSRKDKNGWTYRAMVTRMDTNIGKILSALRASGEMDDTIVLFMSDNGGVGGLEPYSSCNPLRGHKFDEWEGGIRVAAAIRWKNGFASGLDSLDQVTGFVDILPTLSDIVGADAPARAYDGISMYPVLSGRKSRIKRDIYLGLGAIVSQRYKLILPNEEKGLKLKEEFFTDLAADPSERDGKLAGHRRIRARLRKKAQACDAFVPAIPEQPFDKGRKGFKAPKEWNISNL